MGALGAAGIGAYTASKASDAAAQGGANALATQKGMFMTAQNNLSPFINSGTNILPTYQNEATGGAGTFGKTLQDLLTPGMSADVLATMPGFKFASQYGTMAATNALAARGLAGGPGVVGRAISDYNNGLAGQQYFNTVGALQSAYGGRVNALKGIFDTGANAAGNLAGGAISSGNAMAGTQTGIGNALASGVAGVGNAFAGGLTGGANAFATAGLVNKLAPGGSGLYAGGGSGGAANPTGYGTNPWSSGGFFGGMEYSG